MRLIYLPALIIVAAACNKATFGAKEGKHSGGAVLPDSRLMNPEAEPLDVSNSEHNKKTNPDGPKGGGGAVLEKTIELTCENSAGVIVEAGGAIPEGPGTGAEPGKDPGYVPPKVPGKLRLLGKDTAIDTTGKPIGKPDTGSTDGKKPGGDEPLPVFPPIPVPNPMKAVARIKGQFCPTSHNKLTVLFVVDYSGSMGRHIEAAGQPEHPGNDPQVNGSCGRLRAAQAIIGKIKAEARAGDTVEIGMVPFAGGIVTNRIQKITNLPAFEALVTKDTFCQYVVQDASFGYDPTNPGGIDGPTSLLGGLLGIGKVDSSTNYNAAFTAAESLLTGVYGRKVTYFISDGEPTSGGADPVAAGIAAGKSLRDHVDNLTVNGVLLGSIGPSAQAVLEQVAGSPDRVRVADSADQLAAQIALFPDASIDAASGRATLTADPYPRADLGLHYLNPDATNPKIWVYETQAFVLLGKPGVSTLNVVEITARGADGTSYSAVVKINFTP